MKVLIISPHFPPATLAGVHRARHMAKHLHSHGWEPIVIRVGEEHYEETLDPALANLVPDHVMQIRTGAFPAKIARLFGVGDIGLRAYFPIKKAIAKAVATHAPRVIFITGSPFYPLLLSGWIKRRFGIPVVLDLQDPWASKVGATERLWSKRGMSHRLAVMLEPTALQPATFVTSVSEIQNQELANRYAWLTPDIMRAIPIGADPEDFSALRDQFRTQHSELDNQKLFTFRYVGTVTPRFDPLFELLFAGIKHLLAEKPELAVQMKFEFVGTNNQPDDHTTFHVRQIAARYGLADVVTEAPARIPYLEALQTVSTADALLFLGSDEPHYTASRIYSGLMAARPYVSMFHVLSSAHAVLKAARGGIAIPYSTEFPREQLIQSVAEAIFTVFSNSQSIPPVQPSAYAAFTASNVAKQFADIFDRVAQ